MTASELLSSHGYFFEEASGIWRRPGAASIGYSDGAEIERRLEQAVSSVIDRSVDSAEWRAVINDWPSEYHFTPKRANLLRPFPIGAGQRVVELGAGCGAITRWLGETGAEVIAVEGSYARAKIAALRCQDLDNVYVVADDLHATSEFAADWVTLIGVLEYAPIFDHSEDPVAAVLSVAERHLKPDGALLVAIENQMGLKYFAGCAEDHIGIPYFGVEGLYRAEGAVTFGRQELATRLMNSGFSSQQLFLPFPDYKLPELVIQSNVCTGDGFDAGSFIALSVGRDYSGRRAKSFTEPLVWKTVCRNGLLSDLANSFLFVVARDQAGLTKCSPDPSVLAWSFSGDRSPEFATETRIVRADDDLHVVKSHRSPSRRFPSGAQKQWSQTILPESGYYLGERLDLELLRLAASGDTGAFIAAASKWLDELLVRSHLKGSENRDKVAAWECDGQAVDLIPRNIIVGSDGKLQIFDQEWVSASPIPLSWLLIRGVLSFALYAVNGEWLRTQTVASVAQAIAAYRGLTFSDADLEIAQRMDAGFLAWVKNQAPEAASWPLNMLTTPIGEMCMSTADLGWQSREQEAEMSKKVFNLEAQLDAERIAHAKLIGAYERSESSNQSLIHELSKAQAFAVKAQTLQTVAEHGADELRHTIDNLNARLGPVSERLDQVQADYQQRVIDLARKTSEYDQLSQELSTLHSQFADLSKEHALMESSKDLLRSEFDQVAMELQRVNKAHTSEIAEKKMGQQVAQLKNEQEALRTLLDQVERQRSALNAEVLRLNAERARFGAKIGRGITRLRVRIAPDGTPRGSAVGLLARFATAVVASGWKSAVGKTYHYLAFRIHAKRIRNDAARQATSSVGRNDHCSGNENRGGKVETNHPQLTAWIEGTEPNELQLADQMQRASLFPYQPVLSVIIPIYRVPRDVLDETLASLERQTYANWQACIVWSDTDDSLGWEWLRARTSADYRFKIERLVENGGISRNSNAALELVDGEFIALLDHDDTLTPWAFFEIVKRLQDYPQLDFIYSDKDSITADGLIRLNALFKPEWSPEMLHSVNYLTHLNIIRTSLVREIGGWRPETDGAQDWDLFFRITERTNNIARVSSILYHWRILPTSTATGLQAKPYAALGQLKSQQDHFTRRGLAASVVPSPEGMFKVCWPVSAASVDVVVYQTGSLNQLIAVLDVLRAGKQEVIRRIHVIHSSPATDGLNAFNGAWPGRVDLLHIEQPVTWRTALAAALPAETPEAVLLLDGGAAGMSETLAEELSGWVTHHPDIAWASAVALNADGTVYEAGRVVSDDLQSAPLFAGIPLFSFGWFGGPLWYRNARACSPYAVAMRGSDACDALLRPLASGSSKDDFASVCLALLSGGRRGVINPFAKVYFSSSPESSWCNDGDRFHADPYFSPAFSQVSPLRLHS